jgi:hypothetical protein
MSIGDERSRRLDVRVRRRAGTDRLGEQLVAEGLITAAHLDKALAHQRRTGRRIGETLFELGLITSHDLTRVLAQRRGMPFVALASTPIDPKVGRVFPASMAHRLAVVPYADEGDAVVLAMVNPEDGDALASVRTFLNRPVRVEMCDPEGALTTVTALWPGYTEPIDPPGQAAAAPVAQSWALYHHARRRCDALEALDGPDAPTALDVVRDLDAVGQGAHGGGGTERADPAATESERELDRAVFRAVIAIHGVRLATFLGERSDPARGVVRADAFVPGWPGEGDRLRDTLVRLAAHAARVSAALADGGPVESVVLDDLLHDLDIALPCFVAALPAGHRGWFGASLAPDAL